MDAAGKVEPMGGFRFLAWTAAVIMEVSRSKFPKVVRIETTNHCNARCTFCLRASMGREKGFMAQDLHEKIVNECAEGGCSVLHVHNFGEPLLEERIRFAKEKGIKKENPAMQQMFYEFL
jgi:MoaA/NifB/PqqE/SkfB family radical SAM enzyme